MSKHLTTHSASSASENVSDDFDVNNDERERTSKTLTDNEIEVL